MRAEALGAFKGAKGSYNIYGYKFDNTLHLTYLEIPVLAEYNFSDGNGFYAGPYFAFKLSSSNDNDLSAALKALKINLDDIIDGHIKKNDMGICAGFEYGVSNNASIDLRGNYGLTHIVDNSDFINYSFVLGINVYFK